MVAIDNTHDIPSDIRSETPHTGTIVLFAMLISALLAAAAITFGAEDGNSWGLAADIVGRFALLIFVTMMVVEPLARLVPSRFTEALARERSSLLLAFAAASVIALACVAAPSQLGGQRLSAPTIAYCALTAAILVVMLFSSHPATMRFLGAPAWRSMQRVATAYFWLSFTVAGLDHLVGPHRPDNWYGVSLLLLVGALLVRFADTFVAHWRRAALAEKVG